MPTAWNNAGVIPSQSFDCGHCGNRVASSSGYFGSLLGIPGTIIESLHICPHCTRTTSFHVGIQFPGVRPGTNVLHVPPDIEKAYNEARDCMAASAYTAATMLCRKILMHVAVEEKAAENLSFKQYVDYLVANNYVPPKGRGWVDQIRDKGNGVNHELVFASLEEAKDLIGFVEMLLRFNYEFPGKVGAKTPAGSKG
jgi:Domain of unknown function (DUF4145)